MKPLAAAWRSSWNWHLRCYKVGWIQEPYYRLQSLFPLRCWKKTIKRKIRETLLFSTPSPLLHCPLTPTESTALGKESDGLIALCKETVQAPREFQPQTINSLFSHNTFTLFHPPQLSSDHLSFTPSHALLFSLLGSASNLSFLWPPIFQCVALIPT